MIGITKFVRMIDVPKIMRGCPPAVGPEMAPVPEIERITGAM
jgi:hypothetical protein